MQSNLFRSAALGGLLCTGLTAGCAPASQAQVGMPAPAVVRDMVEDWPDASRMAADAMIGKYGDPQGMTSTMLVWHNNGPWQRTIVYRDPVPHHFPMQHMDVLEQFIDYRVPPELFDELAMFDGSLIVERTKGVMSARCDKEAMNLLAINLAHDIVTGRRTVEDARRMYASDAMAFKNGQKPPYTQALQFTPPAGNTMDPDHPVR